MKYLFTATFKDWTIYEQNNDDISIKDKTRSCFFDIIDRLDELKTFKLIWEEHSYLVNLETGHFGIDNVLFSMHEKPLKDFKLIYFRRHTHGFNINNKEIWHDITFRLGWQSWGEQEVMQIT